VTAQQPAIATSCSAPQPDPSSARREKAKSALTTAAQFQALSHPTRSCSAHHTTPQPTLQHTARAASAPFVPLSKKGLFENNQRAVFRPSTTSWTART
jgi:hypothetical protein